MAFGLTALGLQELQEREKKKAQSQVPYPDSESLVMGPEIYILMRTSEDHGTTP